MKRKRILGTGGCLVALLFLTVILLTGPGYAGNAIEIKRPNVNPDLLGKKDLVTLTVEKGERVVGSPGSGMMKVVRGAIVNYNYSSMTKQSPLTVKLDGVAVAHSGVILMNADHKLEAFFEPVSKYRLKVMETYYQSPDIPCYAGTTPCKHGGVPACGESKFPEGAVISYDLWQNWGQIAGVYLAAYPPGAGCPPILRNLGGMAPGEHLTGSFVMDRDYTLVISINIE